MAEASAPKPEERRDRPDRISAGAAAVSAAGSASKPEEGKSGHENPLYEIGTHLAIGFFVLLLGMRALSSLQGGTWGINNPAFRARLEILQPIYNNLVSSYITLANVVSLFFAIGIVYCLFKLADANNQWHKVLYPDTTAAPQAEVKNTRWQLVIQHIQSENPSDWRLAILEADIILGDMLDSLGYIGDTIGDKLKRAERSPFNTLNEAWEAHKIRNAIAHEGQDFMLTQRDARRVISLYEATFSEFDYV
jgi:preprotein translocase subunit SecG